MESMCAETAYLIELTTAFLRDEPVTLRPDIDYRKLCGIAKAHNLIAVVYAVQQSVQYRGDPGGLPTGTQRALL